MQGNLTASATATATATPPTFTSTRTATSTFTAVGTGTSTFTAVGTASSIASASAYTLTATATSSATVLAASVSLTASASAYTATGTASSSATSSASASPSASASANATASASVSAPPSPSSTSASTTSAMPSATPSAANYCAPGFWGTTGCAPCPAGSYCPGGTAALPQACPPGAACPAGSAAPVPCGPGFVQPLPAQPFCDACAVGTYEPDTGETQCLECPPGNFCPAQGAPSPQACPAGTFNPSSGATSNDACAKCPAGTTSPAAGAVSCPTQCAVGCDCPAGSTLPCPAALPWAVAAGADPTRSLGSAAEGPQGLGVVLISKVLPATGYTAVTTQLGLGLSSLGTTQLGAPVAFLGRMDRFTLMSSLDGTGLCEYPPGGGGPEFLVAPVVSPSGLAWTGTSTNLYAFDAKSSSCAVLVQLPAWDGGSFLPDALNLARNTLVAAATGPNGATLMALDSTTGATLGTWSTPAGAVPAAGPLVLSTAAPTVALSYGASVWCLSVPGFASAWPAGASPLTLPGAVTIALGAGPPQVGSPLFAFAAATQVLYALAAADGSQLWSRNFGGTAGPFGAPVAPGSCAAGGACALFLTVGSDLLALDAATGATVWTAAASGGGQLSLCAVGSNGFVFAAAPEGLYGFSATGGTVFLEPHLAAPLACALSDDQLLAVQPGANNANMLSLQAPATPPMPSAAGALSVAVIAGAVVGSFLLAAGAAIVFVPALRAALATRVVRRFRRVRARRGDADAGSLNAPLLP